MAKMYVLPFLLASCVSCYKVLLFWAVDSDPRTQEMVKKNVAHARTSGGPNCCDVMLAHYQGSPDDWDADWRAAEVTSSFVQTGFKFRLLQQAYIDAQHHWEDTYEFVWALDSDLDFSGVNLTKLFSTARASGSLIIGPTWGGEQEWLTWTLNTQVNADGSSRLLRKGDMSNALMTDEYRQEMEDQQKIHVLGKPDPSCSYRHTNFVEMTGTLLHARVLYMLFKKCKDCIGEKAEWGLDRIWCEMASKELTNQALMCALIDNSPVWHLDWKKATVTSDFKSVELAVKEHYPNLWASPKAYDCVKVQV
mmetsp:Transcript_56001/g.99721  ORF Transcript_56001/g.99721 Transcript_56001/m.99721 type:complete len:307 (+) Transcript_56001:108-1028(+)